MRRRTWTLIGTPEQPAASPSSGAPQVCSLHPGSTTVSSGCTSQQ